ncbi:class I SAM-dependent methyltransferase [Halothiobacillus sp.]|uniref:class I SAM-dependent methyltransferase n=1 Tax=Halothiobacillus sp. TaxID=1891311 RepID=UPI003D102DD0
MTSSSSSWLDSVRLVMPAASADEYASSQIQEARNLSIPIIGTEEVLDVQPDHFVLMHFEGCWQLFPPKGSDIFGRHALCIDFVQNARFNQPMALREPLAKAAGLRANRRPMVIDLTAGLGRDAWALASTGCTVFAFERHPLIHFLLSDALMRARLDSKTHEIASRIHLYGSDARVGWPDTIKPDEHTVWLMDPMFPERQKSALVKKDMRIFHELVGADADADALFAWARLQPANRYVVKRPPHAPALAGAMPAMSISSGRVRFDCYIKPTPSISQ